MMGMWVGLKSWRLYCLKKIKSGWSLVVLQEPNWASCQHFSVIPRLQTDLSPSVSSVSVREWRLMCLLLTLSACVCVHVCVSLQERHRDNAVWREKQHHFPGMCSKVSPGVDSLAHPEGQRQEEGGQTEIWRSQKCICNLGYAFMGLWG